METFVTLEERTKIEYEGDLFDGSTQIQLRPEQREAIDLAKEHFCLKTGNKSNYKWTIKPKFCQFLWNAKMRFGKTICALQLAREMDVKRVLIVTHRPVVGESWLNAFNQTFSDKICGNNDIIKDYKYGMCSENSSNNVGNFYDLEKFVKEKGKHYVFFVSMQYLHLSELVNSNTLAKNKGSKELNLFGSNSKENEKLKENILKTNWDLVVIDEAHEGTRTELGRRVIDDYLKKEKTKMLHLSGTPFNLYEDFDKNEIFTWDYIAEQQAKLNWPENHPNEVNPYAGLPKLKIYTYDITKNISKIRDQRGLFTFPEFFRTWKGRPKADGSIMPKGAKGRFVHEEDVKKFLNLLCTKNENNNFPFSTDEYRKEFRHTFWVVSHVDEAKALATLMKEHKIFKKFRIINVAGEGDDEQRESALDAVKYAIGEKPEISNPTITISCGRLTTGVTIEPWSAVLYLKGGDSAATYMQTIFRVQSPYETSEGKMKTSCYVFDFAPDRAIKVVAETAKFSSRTKKKEEKDDSTQEERDKQTVESFIQLCPLISMDNGEMKELDANSIYKQLENVFIDRLVRKGFDDSCLYNMEELNNVDPELINEIGKHGGQAPDENRKEAKNVINLSHMSSEQRKEWEKMIRKKKAEAERKAEEKKKKDAEFKKKWDAMSEEERKKWIQEEAEKAAIREKKKKERAEFKRRITNIRGIALRIPLLMYGGADADNTEEKITVDNFTSKITDESWKEFMPKGISKDDFNKIRKCFNATRFAEAGEKYRNLTKEADFMHVDERIKQITDIFSYFRNPDKETVLTPWSVVNLHMSVTLGGYSFYDEDGAQLTFPHKVKQGEITEQLFENVDENGEIRTKILEINSKTGLYPLYITYSLYRCRLKEYINAECIDKDAISVQEEHVVWDDVATNNIYVICNTPMAVGITKRTLFGFRKINKQTNIKADKLIKKAINNQQALVDEIKSERFWKNKKNKNMIEFNAVVGNPPYQEEGISTRKYPLYHLFYDIAFCLSDKVTLITPGRFLFNVGQTPESWMKKMLADNHFKVVDYFKNSTDIFPTVDIKGGVVITYRDVKKDFGAIGFFSEYSDLKTILKKVEEHKDFVKGQFSGIVFPDGIYKFTKLLFKDYPHAKEVQGKGSGLVVTSNALENIPEVFFIDKPNDGNNYIQIIGRVNNQRVGRWIKSIYIKHVPPLDTYNVLVTKSNGTGAMGEVLSMPIIGVPSIGHTQTFISIGSFTTEYEAKACLKYVSTKFARTMLGTLKATQHNSRDTWANVPMQNFTSSSDIDWNKSIADIDKQLYQKYGLDESEIQFIEQMVKPME